MTSYKFGNIEFDIDETITIWINHSRDKLYGSYIKIDKDNNAYYCVEKPNEVYETLLKGTNNVKTK